MSKIVRATTVLFLVMVFVAVSVSVFAQGEKEQKQKINKTIFDYKSDLKLTDEQVRKIKEYIIAFDKDNRVKRAKLTILDADLRTLFEKEADMNQIRPKVKEAYDIQADMRIADIETARKINSVLTPAQLKKWKEIQAAATK